MKKKYFLILIISFFVFSSSVFAKNYEISPQSGSTCSHPNAWFVCNYYNFDVQGDQQMAFTIELDDEFEDGNYAMDILLQVPSTWANFNTAGYYSNHEPVILDQTGGQIGTFVPIGRTHNELREHDYGDTSSYIFENYYDTTYYTVHFDNILIQNNQINLMFIIFYIEASSSQFRFYDNLFISEFGTATIVDELREANKTLKDDDMSGGNQSADDFKDNTAFDDTTGIESIINLPLNFINSLSSSCQPLQLTLPWLDYPFEIPCLGDLFISKVPLIANILKIVINGFIVYRILLGIVDLIHSAKNPDDDRIEVLEL